MGVSVQEQFSPHGDLGIQASPSLRLHHRLYGSPAVGGKLRVGVQEATPLLRRLHWKRHRPVRNDQMTTLGCQVGGWLGNMVWRPLLCWCHQQLTLCVSSQVQVQWVMSLGSLKSPKWEYLHHSSWQMLWFVCVASLSALYWSLPSDNGVRWKGECEFWRAKVISGRYDNNPIKKMKKWRFRHSR